MGTLIKIVYRNLREHTVKTLIIGSIMAFGLYILVVGNSIVDTVSRGIKKNFIETYTSHVVVVPSNRESPSIMPEPGDIQQGLLPTIPDYRAVLYVVEASRGVEAVSPQIAALASLQYKEAGTAFVQLMAVEPAMYRSVFPASTTVREGRFLRPGEEGIVISGFTLGMLEESARAEIGVGDPVLLTSANEISGMRVREVPIVGIHESELGTLAMVSYLDAENARVLGGLTRITDIQVVLTEKEKAALGSVDEEELFGGDLFEEVTKPEESASVSEPTGLIAADPDAWHFMLVRLEEGARIDRSVREMNRSFAERGLGVEAHSWLEGAGRIATMTSALRTIINVIVLVIAVVAVIIIMNTLVISITERMAEIGTMRAVGAQRSFVRRMIVLETLLIALSFGGVGIVLGLATIGIVNAAHIQTGNMIVKALVGGEVIRVVVSAGSVAVSLFAMIVAGVVASLYPASVALRIEPRQAMAS